MRLGELLKYGLPKSVIDAWISRQGDYLLPLQERAVNGGLLGGNSGKESAGLLISAPTSSGKSFCGEMAAMVSLMARRRVVILVPLKSIAEEKYDYYRRSYCAIGLGTIIVTGDHPENDMSFELGNFDLAVVIYEKFNRLLTVNPDILRQIGLIVVDEFQMLGDPQRGWELELALAKVISSGCRPRLIGLSAVIENDQELAEWLGCDIIREMNRPVDLLQGVAGGGSYHFRSFNSGMEGREEFALADNGDGMAEGLIEFLKMDKTQKLIFLKSRRDTIDAAFKLASVASWREAAECLARLEDEEPSSLVRSLRTTLSRGVAFHNADLTAHQRRVVESGYRRGEIRVIFSTTTLALGVNLPAEMVLFETVKYYGGDFRSKPVLVPISPAEFQNISGRAGRFGMGNNHRPGKAVVLAGSDFEREALWSEYINSKRGEKVQSTMSEEAMPEVVLNLIASGFGGSLEALHRALRGLLYRQQGWMPDSSRLEGIIRDLKEAKLITRDLQATELGSATASSGLSVAGCRHYMRLLERPPESLLGWIFLSLTGPDFDISRAGLTTREHRDRRYEKMLHDDFSDGIKQFEVCVERRINYEPLDFRTSALLKASFLLVEWSRGKDVERLERRYQIHHGQIINLADMAAWLLATVARLVYATDCTSTVPDRLEDYAFSVHFGIGPEQKEIYNLAGTILNRADYGCLAGRNITSIDDLKKMGIDELKKTIKSKTKIENLLRLLKGEKKEDRMMSGIGGRDLCVSHSRAGLNGRATGLYPAAIEIDGTLDHRRYLIKVDGMPVRLTGKSFKYLAVLALARAIYDDGWVYKDELEDGFNQVRYLHRLRKEMLQAGFSWPVFECNRLGYYRLDIEREKLDFNVRNLRNHPDYEISRLARELIPNMAG